MSHQRCVCPQCGTTLRVKDRTYFNRPVPCPDCRTLVVIAPNGDDGLIAQLAEQPVKAMRPSGSQLAPLAAAVSRSQNWTPNVVVVSWMAALLVAGLIAGVAFWPRSPRKTSIVETPAPSDVNSPAADEAHPPQEETPPPDDGPPRPPVVDELADVPIEPLFALDPEPPTAEFPPADAALVADAEIPPQPPPPVVVVDLEAALAQPLVEFRQSRSIPRRDLLDLIEEMLGAPIRYDRDELGAAAQPLDQPISLELERITVGDVLAKVLEGTELTPHREPDGLRLKKTSAPNEP